MKTSMFRGGRDLINDTNDITDKGDTNDKSQGKGIYTPSTFSQVSMGSTFFFPCNFLSLSQKSTYSGTLKSYFYKRRKDEAPLGKVPKSDIFIPSLMKTSFFRACCLLWRFVSLLSLSFLSGRKSL